MDSNSSVPPPTPSAALHPIPPENLTSTPAIVKPRLRGLGVGVFLAVIPYVMMGIVVLLTKVPDAGWFAIMMYLATIVMCYSFPFVSAIWSVVDVIIGVKKGSKVRIIGGALGVVLAVTSIVLARSILHN